MTSAQMGRALVAFASVMFAGLALACWAAPLEVARRLGLEAIGAGGATSVRAEVGGLFGGMAVLCAVAAWRRSRSWVLAQVAVLGAIVAGRLFGWASGGISGDAAAMAVEVGLLGALMAMARATEAPAHPPRQGRWRLAAIVAAALLASIAGVSALVGGGVEQRLFEAGAKARTGSVNTAPLADDALRVAICGSSAPLPSAARAKACVAVFAGGRFYVVDAGPESTENLVLWGVPLSAIGGVLLTHFHSDHIGDLGELSLQTWAGGRPSPLAVYGGPGVAQVVDGFNRAYTLDQGYRTAHHTAKVMPPETWPMVARTVTLEGPVTPAKDRSAIVLDEGGLRITAFEVDHAPIAPAYAYRFDYKGRSVLITGDLKNHAPLVTAAKGVDLLVSEAIAVQMTRALGAGANAAGRDRTAAIMHDIEDYHITPAQAAAIANQAGARLLVFYHLLPAPDGGLMRRVFAQGLDDVRPEGWTIADDGSLYTLPMGTSEVRLGRIGE